MTTTVCDPPEVSDEMTGQQQLDQQRRQAVECFLCWFEAKPEGLGIRDEDFLPVVSRILGGPVDPRVWAEFAAAWSEEDDYLRSDPREWAARHDIPPTDDCLYWEGKRVESDRESAFARLIAGAR